MTATLTESPAVPDRQVSGRLLLVLALLACLAPFATDLYLPAFPTMTEELGTDATRVQLTLTAFLLGTGAGQLIFGPLSDRMGRLRPLLIGTSICVVASVAAALAPTISVLIVARLVQGLSGAAGMVIGRAIISDLATGPAATRALSLMMTVTGVAPAVAPLIGGILTPIIGWRGILWVVAAIVAVMLVVVAVVVRETLPAGRRRQRSKGGATSLRPLISRAFLGHALSLGFAFSAMMAYISASPFLYQTMIGVTPTQYGLLFGINAVGLMLVGSLGARLSRTMAARRLLGIGLYLTVAASIVSLVLVVAGVPTAWLPIPIFVTVSSLGLVMGPATALALAAGKQVAGTASAGLGALQFGLGAVVSPLVSLQGEHSAVPLVVIMVIGTFLATIAYHAAGSGSRNG